MEISRDKYATLNSIPNREKNSTLDVSLSRDKYASLDNCVSKEKYASLNSMPNLIYSGQTPPLNVSSREFPRDCGGAPVPGGGEGSFWTPPPRSHLNPLSGSGSVYEQEYNAYHSTMDTDTYTGSTPGGSTGHNSFYNAYGASSELSSINPLQGSNNHPWTTTGVFYTDFGGTRELHPLQRSGYAGTDSNGNYPGGDYHHSSWSSVQPCDVLDMHDDVINKHYSGVSGVAMGDMDQRGLELSSCSSNTCGGGGGGGGGAGGGGKRKRRRVITIDQRRAANVRERRRMSHLNEAFDGLRKRVPTFAYEKKLSRIDTLRLSVMYIKFMAELLDSLSVVADGGCVNHHGVPSVGTCERRGKESMRDKRGGGAVRGDLSLDVRSGVVRSDLSVDDRGGVRDDVGVLQEVGGVGGGQDVPRGLQRMSSAVGSVCTDDEEEESYLSDPSEGEESGRSRS